MRRGALLSIAWLAWAWLATIAAPVAAAPFQVEIRAQTKLVLDRVRTSGDDEAEIDGQLLDDLTGDGLASQAVRIQVGDHTEKATTGPDGRFHVKIGAGSGPQRVTLSFHGGSTMSDSHLSQTVDPARAQVALTLETEDAPGGARITVRAVADDAPVQLPIALSAGPQTGALAALAQVTSGTPYLLVRTAVGGPGTRRVRAAFAGDALRQAAQTERTIELTAGSTTTIQLGASRIAYEDDLAVTGKVTDEDGHPVGRAAVTLSSGDRRLAQSATTDDGSYRFRVEGGILGQGQWGLQVQAEPGKPAIRPSRSSPEIIRVSAPQPVPVSYTIAAFLATACAAGGFFAARARPWHKLRRAAPPAEAPASAAEDEPTTGGIVVAKPGLVSTLRRANDDSVSGVVRDAVRGRPVAGAVVRLRLGGAEQTATTASDGGFAFETLAHGDWITEVSASGHITESFVVAIPHRGELRGVRVDLVPVRERVFQLYRRAAEPILPEARLWGVWSPRQIVDHVRSRRPSPALADLTSFVEEIYFSARVSEEAVLAIASERVDLAIRERARTAN